MHTNTPYAPNPPWDPASDHLLFAMTFFAVMVLVAILTDTGFGR